MSFTVEPGQVLAVVGPNGSGKSTLLKLLVGELVPDSGHATILDWTPGSRAARLNSGYVPEDLDLLPHLSGRALLLYLAALRGIDRRQRSAACARWLEEVGLTAAADLAVGTYSKGMRRRLLLAQALVHEPRVLLLDEPFEGLDPFGIARLKDVVRGRRGASCSIVITSHLLADVEAIATHLLMLREGRTLLHGPLDEVLADQGDDSTWVVRGLERAAADQAILQIRALGGEVASVTRRRRSLEEIFLAEQAQSGGRQE